MCVFSHTIQGQGQSALLKRKRIFVYCYVPVYIHEVTYHFNKQTFLFRYLITSSFVPDIRHYISS